MFFLQRGGRYWALGKVALVVQELCSPSLYKFRSGLLLKFYNGAMGCHHCLLLKVRFIELDCKELIVADQGKLLQSLHPIRYRECGTRGRGWMELCHPA